MTGSGFQPIYKCILKAEKSNQKEIACLSMKPMLLHSFSPLQPVTSIRRDTSGNPHALCENYLTNIDTRPYADIRDDHVAEHQYFFQRVDLDLGSTETVHLPTDERLNAVKAGASDPGLIVLYFQYGRYLLMGSSRPGCLPANLQGIWNEHMNAPWNSDFHTNINLQMNYWVPEICNLPECHIPLFDYMDTLVEPGEPDSEAPLRC